MNSIGVGRDSLQCLVVEPVLIKAWVGKGRTFLVLLIPGAQSRRFLKKVNIVKVRVKYETVSLK